MPPYIPIDCNFYDRLLHHATRRETVEITYQSSEGTGEMTIHAIIQDVYTREGAEYLQLKKGETIRLDRLVRVGGEDRPASAGCGTEEGG